MSDDEANRRCDEANRRCPVCGGRETRHFIWTRGRNYYRCEACMATYLAREQLPTLDEERARYDEHRNDPDDPGYRDFLNRLAGPLLTRLYPGAHGLDFGCGPGPALVRILEEAGMEMRCYDPFYDPDAGALKERYDFVTATEVLEHLHEPARTICLLDALVKPGGYLGVMTEFLTEDAAFANWYYRSDISHVVFYREETLRTIGKRMGWEIVIPRKNVALFRKPLHSVGATPSR